MANNLSWLWIGELKQVDGGFSVTVDGEEDVRYEHLYVLIVEPVLTICKRKEGPTAFCAPWRS